MHGQVRGLECEQLDLETLPWRAQKTSKATIKARCTTLARMTIARRPAGLRVCVTRSVLVCSDQLFCLVVLLLCRGFVVKLTRIYHKILGRRHITSCNFHIFYFIFFGNTKKLAGRF